eukprot:PhM_4_TR18611/c5_g1_i2/m.83750
MTNLLTEVPDQSSFAELGELASLVEGLYFHRSVAVHRRALDGLKSETVQSLGLDMGGNVNLRKDFLLRFFTARGRTLAWKCVMVLRNYHQDLALELHKNWEIALGPRYSGTVAEAKKIVLNSDKSFLGDNLVTNFGAPVRA